MKAVALAAAATLAATLAWGVDLKNEDSSAYELKIKDGAATTSSSIEANTTRVSICSDCTIEVVGVGEIAAAGDQVVLIKDGALTIAE